MKSLFFYSLALMSFLLSCSNDSRKVTLAINNQSGIRIDSLVISIPSANVVVKSLQSNESRISVLTYNPDLVPKTDGSFQYKIYYRGEFPKAGNFGYYTNGSVDLISNYDIKINKELLVEARSRD